ncbi:MAG TPA: hypothetical protein VHX64_06270, partial [Caulobacteraceae bacterium]|nr:hypothetical protein [Caulobacteraceae bacterium]
NCSPPSPPPPPSPPCCHQINFPGVNISIGATVVASANAQSFAVSGASSGASTFFGGGGGYWSMGEGPVGLIQGLNVEGGVVPQRVAYEAERTKIRIVVIQALCIDDKEVPHPASQVTADREIDEHYEGELFRCIAGTHMQATLADYHGEINFEHGDIINCAKGEALYRWGDGKVACKAQIPARDCNERSLLRRFGAGVKIVKMLSVERYVAYREEVTKSAQVQNFNMTIDGGVGGVVR